MMPTPSLSAQCEAADLNLSDEDFGDLLTRLFAFSPIAMVISTTGPGPRRYVKANKAFIDLTGYSWEEMAGRDMLECGPTIDTPARDRRTGLLDDYGGYMLEEVEIRHASGKLIPTLVSSQRSAILGIAYDVYMLVDVSERVAMQKARERDLALAALTDSLTDLPNRMGFDLHLFSRLAEADPQQRVALAFIDLNGFKRINDRYGHAKGDEALKIIAARLRDHCREGDFAARIGGDEFAIVLDATGSHALDLEKTMRRIADAVFVPVAMADGSMHPIGAAIGIALQNGPDNTIDDLFHRADRKMYLAKSTGHPVWIRTAPLAENELG